jgi:hypothetical protein
MMFFPTYGRHPAKNLLAFVTRSFRETFAPMSETLRGFGRGSAQNFATEMCDLASLHPENTKRASGGA